MHDQCHGNLEIAGIVKRKILVIYSYPYPTSNPYPCACLYLVITVFLQAPKRNQHCPQNEPPGLE